MALHHTSQPNHEHEAVAPHQSPPPATTPPSDQSMASSPSLVALAVVALLALLSPAVLAAGGGREERARIRVYVHEQFTGPNATVGSVASSQPGDNSTFGMVGVVDDVLRAGPDPSSPEVGRYQGLFAGADLAGTNYFSAITLVFTAGDYNGSTLSLQGNYAFPVDDALERAVVGGTGAFRMARGVSMLRVVSAETDASVFQLDLVVFTPRRRRG
ncbi:unnamed protein product [Urochloa humidicola]